jgi:predicted nucleotidyltransferase
LKRKKTEFKELFDIREIGLYGSYARDEQKDSSDIDIVYVLDDQTKFGYSEYLQLDEMLSKEFHKKIELVNFKYMNPLIKYKAEKEIIYV